MTFTLLGYDRDTGAVGLAMASAMPAIGGIAPRFRPGVGVMVTQHFPNLFMADAMLDELATMPAGGHPGHLYTSIGSFVPALRQYGYATFGGLLFGWTGHRCEPLADHVCEQDCLALGHSLPDPVVLSAMVERFCSTGGPFADRLLSALIAGNAIATATEDKNSGRRRILSSCLMVWAPDYPDVEELPIDFRVDLHQRPVLALAEILNEYRAMPRPMRWRPEPLVVAGAGKGSNEPPDDASHDGQSS